MILCNCQLYHNSSPLCTCVSLVPTMLLPSDISNSARFECCKWVKNSPWMHYKCVQNVKYMYLTASYPQKSCNPNPFTDTCPVTENYDNIYYALFLFRETNEEDFRFSTSVDSSTHLASLLVKKLQS